LCLLQRQTESETAYLMIMADKMWTDERVDCLTNYLENEKFLCAMICRDYGYCDVRQQAMERVV
jgi:hypothetical protein